MPDLNAVLIAGNLTRDPEIRILSSGKSVGELGLAINNKFTNSNGEVKEEVVFVDVEVWDRQAETCQQYLLKGSPVLIEGRLKLDQWETKEGEKKSRLRVRATRVQFLGGKPEGGSNGGARGDDRQKSAQRPSGNRDDRNARRQQTPRTEPEPDIDF